MLLNMRPMSIDVLDNTYRAIDNNDVFHVGVEKISLGLCSHFHNTKGVLNEKKMYNSSMYGNDSCRFV